MTTSDSQATGSSPQVIHLRKMLKSKIHRITVTAAEIAYPGSLTLDTELLEAAGLYEYEAIDVVNVNNGERFSTYLIAGSRGECCLNGAAARLGVVGDILILMSFDLVDPETAKAMKPRVVHVDANNAITTTEGP